MRRKVYVLRLEVSCGDSGLWFGPIKKKNLLGQVSFKSDDFFDENFENFENFEKKIPDLKKRLVKIYSAPATYQNPPAT